MYCVGKYCFVFGIGYFFDEYVVDVVFVVVGDWYWVECCGVVL